MIPHEQSHAAQHAAMPREQHLPRWFEEGLAEWVGMEMARRWNPEVYRDVADSRAQALEAATKPLDLGNWAYFRSMEDISQADGALEGARYAAAGRLFERIDREAGRARLRVWLHAVWRQEGEVSTERIVALAREHTGLDIEPWLR